MSDFEKLKNEFIEYNPMIFDLDSIEKSNILDSVFDVQFSNNICFPELKLGFHHFIHQSKYKMEATEEFANRKKIYLVTSLFEKNIDYKDKTDSQIEYTSINNGLNKLIKLIKPDFPPLLNRAFLKMWELIVNFNLIPETEHFTSSHLAEGPGSFIQATILFRELQAKLNKIKSCSKDNYYGVTLHSDHEHLLMHQDFIKFFNKENPKRLHIMETKSLKELKEMYGGSKNIHNKTMTNGDLTKLNTIIQFAGKDSNDKNKDIESFAKPSDLVTSDGGFDWKRENLQEQEAYRLIFSEITTALKIQKDGGNFVIKIFESYTKITIKIIQLLRQIYSSVYIAKPYTSRISNSEKYLVCKGFKKSIITIKIINRLEEQIKILNKNEQYNVLDMFTDINLTDSVYNSYKLINSELLLKQYIGINNIIKFINLDNYNGIEFNEFLDKQIIAAHFWNDLFLNTELYQQIYKFFKKFNFIQYKKENIKKLELFENSTKHQINSKSITAPGSELYTEENIPESKSEFESETETETETKTETETETKTKIKTKTESETESESDESTAKINNKTKKSSKSSKSSKLIKNKETKEHQLSKNTINSKDFDNKITKQSKSEKKNKSKKNQLQNGGGNDENSENDELKQMYENTSVKSSDEIIGVLNSDELIDLNNL